jgi:hypothetical protein
MRHLFLTAIVFPFFTTRPFFLQSHKSADTKTFTTDMSLCP